MIKRGLWMAVVAIIAILTVVAVVVASGIFTPKVGEATTPQIGQLMDGVKVVATGPANMTSLGYMVVPINVTNDGKTVLDLKGVNFTVTLADGSKVVAYSLGPGSVSPGETKQLLVAVNTQTTLDIKIINIVRGDQYVNCVVPAASVNAPPKPTTKSVDSTTPPTTNPPSTTPAPTVIPAPTTTPAPAPEKEGEPSLWMEYETAWGDDSVQYGMPWPYSNTFTVQTNEYGPGQPSGVYHITNIIHISGVAPRSGVTGPQEGSVEIRTYPPGQVSRLVNLYDDGSGGCYGLLVGDWSTWTTTWDYEHGKTIQNSQTFSINITAFGSHTIDIYAIDDHGDGSYDVVSNHLTRTFTTKANSLVNTLMGAQYGYLETSYTNGKPFDFQVTSQRGTYQSDIHGYLPYVYTGKVNVRMYVEGAVGKVTVNGKAVTGQAATFSVWGTNYLGQVFDLGSWDAAGVDKVVYEVTMSFNDGLEHRVYVESTDAASNTPMGNDYRWFNLLRPS
jgi:hypothetical protein